MQADPTAEAYGAVTVEGLDPTLLAGLGGLAPTDEAWFALLAMRVDAEGGDGGELPPVLGRCAVEGDVLVFRPRFPPRAGLAYRIRLDGPALAARAGVAAAIPVVESTFRAAPATDPPATRVVAVQPSAEVVPANLLRVYLHFSAPMRRRDVPRHVRILDEGGRSVALPFVEIEEGLWDPAGRRLTLLFHPGRLKRGVGPNVALGTPLREGERYTLVVEPGFLDADGRPLAEGFAKPYAVGPADRTSPDPATWALAAPAGPGDDLRLAFPEPLDAALLSRLLTVETAAGLSIPGRIVVEDGETAWRFTPEAPWTPGSYRVVAPPALEDLAGNRLDRLFDDEDAPGEPAEESPRILAFEVGEAPSLR